MAVPISMWADELTVLVPGATEQATRQALRATIREFCSKSGAWVREMNPISIEAGVPTYNLNLSLTTLGATVLYIMSVQYRHGSDESTPDADFEPSFVRMLAPVQSPEWKVKSKGPSNVPIAYAGDHENPALLRIIPTVNVDKPWALVPIVALRPSMNLNIDENIPDVFAEVHFDAILEGAAGRLMSQQDKPYSNVIMAQYYLRRFRIAMSMARDIARRQYTSADADFTFPGWADRRGENRRTAL